MGYYAPRLASGSEALWHDFSPHGISITKAEHFGRPTEATLFSGCQQLPAAPSAFAAVKQPSKPPVACASQPDQRREPWARWQKLEAESDERVTFKIPQSPLPAMNNLVGTGAARKLNSAPNSAPPITRTIILARSGVTPSCHPKRSSLGPLRAVGSGAGTSWIARPGRWDPADPHKGIWKSQSLCERDAPPDPTEKPFAKTFSFSPEVRTAVEKCGGGESRDGDGE